MKNVLKIVAIVSMLLLTVFAGGCGQSQDKKYLEARNEFVAMQQQFDKANAERQKLIDKQSLAEFTENYIKLVGGFQKDSEKKLQNMAELAKGKLELTKDLEQVKQEHKKKFQMYFDMRDDAKEMVKKLQQKLQQKQQKNK